ncbi:MAG: hypothetical protein A2X94_12730 [Bdellovibrionales bacterium GWB1_55_8]|nr:MAG: hypothetical protein A2X94_12730 [Bdellovibrionales bacterium GWB1_55_8]
MRNVGWLFHLSFFLLLGATSAYALTSTPEPRIPESLQSRAMYPTIVELQNDGDVHCPSGIFEHLHSSSTIRKVAEKLDLSPGCIWKTIRKNAENRKKPVHGFAFGSVSEISMTAGIGVSTELVIMKYDEKTLMIGQVYTEAGVVSIGLPGVSLNQSVIYGHCADGIFGYLGWFDTISALALSHNYGKAAYAPPTFGTYSGCNSLTSTRGTTTPILGASQSYYHQNSPFILVGGPRAAPLLKYISELNRRK